MLNIDGSSDPNYRYKMPRVVGKVEGRGNGIKTVIVNAQTVAASLKRPTDQVVKFIGLQMGAQSRYDGDADKAIVNGAIDTNDLQKHVFTYIDKFVRCHACGNPETVQGIKGKKKAMVLMLTCKACGKETEADNDHKLCTFILKELSAEGGDKKKVTTPSASSGTGEAPTGPDAIGAATKLADQDAGASGAGSNTGGVLSNSGTTASGDVVARDETEKKKKKKKKKASGEDAEEDGEKKKKKKHKHKKSEAGEEDGDDDSKKKKKKKKSKDKDDDPERKQRRQERKLRKEAEAAAAAAAGIAGLEVSSSSNEVDEKADAAFQGAIAEVVKELGSDQIPSPEVAIAAVKRAQTSHGLGNNDQLLLMWHALIVRGAGPKSALIAKHHKSLSQASSNFGMDASLEFLRCVESTLTVPTTDEGRTLAVKTVPVMLKSLLDAELLDEQTIVGWYKNEIIVPHNRKRSEGRVDSRLVVNGKQLTKPLVDWLEESEDSEEEDDDEEEEDDEEDDRPVKSVVAAAPAPTAAVSSSSASQGGPTKRAASSKGGAGSAQQDTESETDSD